jgi:carotenoid cleavage dioxygenase
LELRTVTTVDPTSPATMTNRYLTGYMAPVDKEVTAFDLPVTGDLPPELDGRYLRNGPNPIAADAESYHWFTGAGMVHGVRLRDGRAEWYRNRWVRAGSVPEALGEPDPGGPVLEGMDFAANTNVIAVGGRTFAIVEAGGWPVELDDELKTIARNPFDGTLEAAFTAHPKRDPATGLLHAITYFWPEEAVRYVVVGPDARVRHEEVIPVGRRPMVHDTAITETRVLVFDMPVLFDLELAAAGSGLPYAWKADEVARLGVLPLNGSAADVVWCELPQCFVYHPLNAYDLDDGGLVVDVVKWPKTFDVDDRKGPGNGPTTLVRWTVDPASGKVAEELLHDATQEFPRCDERLVGRRHRYGYTSAFDIDRDGWRLHKHDLESGTTEVWDPGSTSAVGEAVFVPRDGSTAEDDGWLMTLVHDTATASSDLVLLAAQDVAAGPVARVHLPQRVPAGFHGNWCPTP